MAIPKLQINPVNVGAGPDDGTGDKLRNAVEKLNSNDASLEEVLAFILAGADPELTTFRQIAQIIYDFNTVVQALPVPATIQAQVTAAINAALAQLPTPESYTAQIQTAIAAAVAALDANNLVKKSGDQFTGALDFAATVSVASAATTDLSNTASNNIEVTGTATITSFGVRPAGAIRFVRFRDTGLVLTHHATNLILPGAADIVTQAGDTAIVRSHGSGGWRVFAYQRANGAPLIKATLAQAQAGTDDVGYMTPAAVAAAVAKLSPPGASLDDVRTLAIQLAKLKGSTVGMAAGVADDFKDASGIDTSGSLNAGYDSGGNQWLTSNATVSALLHFDGSIADDTGRTFTAYGGAATNPAQKKFGSASLITNSAGSYVTCAPSLDFAFGTGDFTVEAFIYPASLTTGNIFDLRLDDGSGSFCVFLQNSKLGFYDSSGNKIGTANIPGSAWSHIAIVRSLGVLKTFINGVLDVNVAYGSNLATAVPFRMGAGYGNGQGDNYTGYIDEVRVTKGQARYTANFTPPTAAFTLAGSQPATPGMDLRSVAFTAAAVPAKGSLFALVKATTGAITLNTNLLADISRDGGTTWTTGTLVAAGSYGGFTMYEANGFDISGQPSGTSMKWRLRTVGTALGVAVDAVVAQWG